MVKTKQATINQVIIDPTIPVHIKVDNYDSKVGAATENATSESRISPETTNLDSQTPTIISIKPIIKDQNFLIDQSGNQNEGDIKSIDANMKLPYASNNLSNQSVKLPDIVDNKKPPKTVPGVKRPRKTSASHNQANSITKYLVKYKQ